MLLPKEEPDPILGMKGWLEGDLLGSLGWRVWLLPVPTELLLWARAPLWWYQYISFQDNQILQAKNQINFPSLYINRHF